MPQDFKKQIQTMKDRIVAMDMIESNTNHIIDFITESELNLRPKTVRTMCSVLSAWALVAPERPFRTYQYKRDILPTLTCLLAGKQESSCNTYKFIVKKFFQFVHGLDPSEREFPECVRKIKIKRCIRTGDRLVGKILEPEEIRRIVECADNLRDKAMFEALYDGALRVSELLSMKIGGITFDKPVHGTARIVVTGKTGTREVSPLTTSVPALKRWIDSHPDGKNPDAFVWCHTKGVSLGQVISSGNVYALVKKLAARAGIEKKVWTHLFRHSKGTFMARLNINEDARMRFMGHKTTDMQRVYTHMGATDAENIILERNGIRNPQAQVQNPLAPQLCPKCGAQNPATAQFCACGQMLDLRAAMEMDKEVIAIGRMVKELIQGDPILQERLKQRMKEMYSA